jgi:S-formylglutathione hydrolase FrmB
VAEFIGDSPVGAVFGGRLTPMAMVTVDGGGGYWNPHPNDDPLGMVIDELIPRCQSGELGKSPHRVATMGVSMGGYGALEIAEQYPHLISAVAAISPAVWTSYEEAKGANAAAFTSARAFAAGDVITHAPALPATSTTVISGGCHGEEYFFSQVPPSMEFLSQHLR